MRSERLFVTTVKRVWPRPIRRNGWAAAMRTRLEPFMKLERLLRGHPDGILPLRMLRVSSGDLNSRALLWMGDDQNKEAMKSFFAKEKRCPCAPARCASCAGIMLLPYASSSVRSG